MKRWLKISHFANGGKLSYGGYTITETLIVLAVTTAMFVAIMTVFSGRQARVEFNQSVRDYETMLQGIISDVNRGVYSTSEGRECNVIGSNAVVDPTSPTGVNDAGTGGNCVFIGKALSISSSRRSSEVWTTVGGIVDLSSSSSLQFSLGATYTGDPYFIPSPEVKSHSYQLRVNKIVSIDETNSPGLYPEIQRVVFFSGNVFKTSQFINKSTFIIGFADMGTVNTVGSINSKVMFCLEGQSGNTAEIEVGSTTGDDSLFTQIDTDPQPGEPCA